MPTPESAGAPPSLSDAISRLMENPEIISTVASALGNMSAARDQPSDKPDKEAESAPVSSEPEPSPASPSSHDLSALVSSLAPIMSGLTGAGGGHTIPHKSERDSDLKRREELLCALKPYVSDGRREAIDYIIRISRVSELLKSYSAK